MKSNLEDQKSRDSIGILRQDKLRAEVILSSMADGIVAADSNGIITLFNKAASSIFNTNESAVVGKKLEDADLHPEVARLGYECVSTQQTMQVEITLPGWPQRVIDIRATPFGIKDNSGDNAMIILHDLTEIKQHERNQKEFVSNVSHELRTPITSVRATAEALLAGAKDDDDLADRFLHTIISESDRLSALIDDLMEITKRDSGITKTERFDAKISEIVAKIVNVVRPQIEQKNLTLSVHISDGLMCYCDDRQILRMIRNLVDNAVKYTPEGGVIELNASKDGDNMLISVRDTGIGIPHGEIERIFERFYRVDKARSRRLGGTGLGLAIVKDIVNAHNGNIVVDTQLGKGSTFIVTLPGASLQEQE